MTQTSFSQMYARKSGSVVLVTYAEGDRVMQRFGDEQPEILHIMWTAAEAVERVETIRKAQINADHAEASALNRPRFEAIEIDGVRTYVRCA
jgi:hypothetical protein